MRNLQPLSGVTVVELAHWMAGPAAGGVMADWGADVVKVEPPGGDPMRSLWAGMGMRTDLPNGGFDSANRGKRSVELDVTTEAGRAAFERMLETADVLLTNLRPSALERLGLAPPAVTERHPRLVYLSITAYGWGGPDQERAGYDLAAFYARSGVAHEITTQGQPPAPQMQGIGDSFTALAGVAGVLAALYERQQTGRGRLVEASLLRTGMWALAGDLGMAAAGAHPRPPKPREETANPMYNSYRAGDGRWFFLVGVQSGRQFPKVLGAVGRLDLLEDERFANPQGLVEHSRELIALLDEAFATQPLAHWAKALDDHDVVWAPVQDPYEVLADTQARATGALVTLAGVGTEAVEAPVRFDRAHRDKVAGPPALGAHTAEVLAALGYTPAEIAALQDRSATSEGR